ncbi:hypothetical protein [Sorangium sp. So ce1078]|uniref:hypothetical protein n=1 Tax=Sorangium sp. So ce1078 TaxID=3133329 RepID=UPI003F5FB016
MSKLEIRFGSPEHGWLYVELRALTATRCLDVSDVPADSLSMLASAAAQVASGCDEASATWFLEPEEEEWVFRRTEAGVELSIRRRTGRGRTSETRLVSGTAEEVPLPIWRAFRRLRADPAWRERSEARVWSHEFPEREVASLGELLGKTGRR